VLLAAAVHALAADAGMNGPQVAALPLTSPVRQTSLLTTPYDHALSALQACPFGELGSGEREQLVSVYGTPRWPAVRAAAQTVVEHHFQDAVDHGCPHSTISDRASAMAAARREQIDRDRLTPPAVPAVGRAGRLPVRSRCTGRRRPWSLAGSRDRRSGAIQ
jgi:hypothetical protein